MLSITGLHLCHPCHVHGENDASSTYIICQWYTRSIYMKENVQDPSQSLKFFQAKQIVLMTLLYGVTTHSPDVLRMTGLYPSCWLHTSSSPMSSCSISLLLCLGKCLCFISKQRFPNIPYVALIFIHDQYHSIQEIFLNTL